VPKLEVREHQPSTLRNVDVGPPGGCWRYLRQRPPPKLKALMTAPLGVLIGSPASATTEVEDVHGGPPEGCWRQVRQRPSPKLETSMADPLGVLTTGPAAATTEVGDVDGGPPGGAGSKCPGAPSINAKKHRRRAPGRSQS
jgi:hypothetical protein